MFRHLTLTGEGNLHMPYLEGPYIDLGVPLAAGSWIPEVARARWHERGGLAFQREMWPIVRSRGPAGLDADSRQPVNVDTGPVTFGAPPA